MKLGEFRSNRYKNGPDWDQKPQKIMDNILFWPARADRENRIEQAGRPGPEFQAWSRQHARDARRHAADLAQITRHHDLNPAGDAVRQLQAWALRHAREKHLHESAIAQIRRP
ncbi:MAG: hypothetical protein WD136_04005 [Cyanobium sp.]